MNHLRAFVNLKCNFLLLVRCLLFFSQEAIRSLHVAFAEFRLTPAAVDFGRVQIGGTYRLALQLHNSGQSRGRFQVAQPSGDPNSLRALYRPGFVAAGMTVRLELEFFAGQLGSWSHQLQLTSERSVFRLPVCAHVVASAAEAGPPLMTAAAAATKLGVPRLVATVPSQHVVELYSKLRLSIPSFQQGAVSFSSVSAVGSSSAFETDDLDDGGDSLEQQLARDLGLPSVSDSALSAEPRVPDLMQRPFVDPSMTLDQIKKIAAVAK